MKKLITLVLGITLLFGLGACKEKSAEVKTKQTAQSQTSATEVEPQEDQDSEPIYRYVIAPNGLSLRAANTLDSEKLAGLPLGSKVSLLEETTETPLKVEHIKGAMHHIQYKEHTGYAFSGYLSSIPLPEKEQSVEDYLAGLKTIYPVLSFESKANDPDFHEGTTDTFTLPTSSWHEAYYLVAAIYQLPKNLGFPSPTGLDLETIEDPEKPQDAWSSFITVTRENNTLTKIEYAYRAEGFGYGIDIIRESEKLFRVAFLGFVD